MRNRKKDTDKKQNRHRDDSQPNHHELPLVLVFRGRRNSKYERESAKNIRQRLDHVPVIAHLFTATFELDVPGGGRM